MNALLPEVEIGGSVLWILNLDLDTNCDGAREQGQDHFHEKLGIVSLQGDGLQALNNENDTGRNDTSYYKECQLNAMSYCSLIDCRHISKITYNCLDGFLPEINNKYMCELKFLCS